MGRASIQKTVQKFSIICRAFSDRPHASRLPADPKEAITASTSSGAPKASIASATKWIAFATKEPPTNMTTSAPSPRGRIGELVTYFLRLGLLGFGGPVALVGQMERELVSERGWLTREQMREAIAICQSLPGPLAIQVGIFIAYLRCGFWGAWAGGWAFILPSFLIVAALGALYV